jgi:hypothetical protein
MKITTKQISSLVRRILLEGYQDDLKQLQDRFPEQLDVLSAPPFTGPKGPKWTAWLSARFLTGARGEPLPMEHVAYTLKDFEQLAEQRLVALWNQPAFKTAVDQQIPPARRNWTSPTDITNMSASDMDTLLQLAAQADAKKRDRLGIDYETVSVDGDRLGTVGPWTLWMPTTRENSCAIVRVKNPFTSQMVPSPCTWCTAKTDGSNLFYHYVARREANIILYYVIKQDAQRGDDYISIGFLNGEPVLRGEFGGVTVNCENNGLTESRLRDIFGSHYDTIMNILTSKSREIGGQHPAKQKIVAATQSLEALNYLIRGVGKEERADMAKTVLEWDPGNMNPQVAAKCLELLINSKNDGAKIIAAQHPYCPPHILEKLSDDENPYVKSSAISNPNYPPHILENLSEDVDYVVRKAVAQNRNCPPHILEKLSDDENEDVRTYVARNPNCPPHILEKLFDDDNNYVSYYALRNPNLPPKIKNDWELLSNHKNPWIIMHVAENRNCPPHILEKISLFDNKKDPNIAARIRLVKNPACTPKALENLVNNTKRKDMKKLVIKHRNCPPGILRSLSRDPDPIISRAAFKVMKKRGIQLESLYRKISKLIHAVK